MNLQESNNHLRISSERAQEMKVKTQAVIDKLDKADKLKSKPDQTPANDDLTPSGTFFGGRSGENN